MRDYELIIRKELASATKKVVLALTPHIQEGRPGSHEGKVFFLKICGDFCRYMYECNSNLSAVAPLLSSTEDDKSTKVIWGAIPSEVLTPKTYPE